MSNLANIAIGLIVVGLLLVRQLQPRPARETRSIRLVLILAASGIAEIAKTIGTRHLIAGTVAWLAVSLMVGAGLGDPRGHGQDLAGTGRISLAARDHAHRRPVADLPGRPPRPRHDHRPRLPDRRPGHLEHPALPSRHPRSPA
jgi:hypothetical protein